MYQNLNLYLRNARRKTQHSELEADEEGRYDNVLDLKIFSSNYFAPYFFLPQPYFELITLLWAHYIIIGDSYQATGQGTLQSSSLTCCCFCCLNSIMTFLTTDSEKKTSPTSLIQ